MMLMNIKVMPAQRFFFTTGCVETQKEWHSLFSFPFVPLFVSSFHCHGASAPISLSLSLSLSLPSPIPTPQPSLSLCHPSLPNPAVPLSHTVSLSLPVRFTCSHVMEGSAPLFASFVHPSATKILTHKGRKENDLVIKLIILVVSKTELSSIRTRNYSWDESQMLTDPHA